MSRTRQTIQTSVSRCPMICSQLPVRNLRSVASRSRRCRFPVEEHSTQRGYLRMADRASEPKIGRARHGQRRATVVDCTVYPYLGDALVRSTVVQRHHQRGSQLTGTRPDSLASSPVTERPTVQTSNSTCTARTQSPAPLPLALSLCSHSSERTEDVQTCDRGQRFTLSGPSVSHPYAHPRAFCHLIRYRSLPSLELGWDLGSSQPALT